MGTTGAEPTSGVCGSDPGLATGGEVLLTARVSGLGVFWTRATYKARPSTCTSSHGQASGQTLGTVLAGHSTTWRLAGRAGQREGHERGSHLRSGMDYANSRVRLGSRVYVKISITVELLTSLPFNFATAWLASSSAEKDTNPPFSGVPEGVSCLAATTCPHPCVTQRRLSGTRCCCVCCRTDWGTRSAHRKQFLQLFVVERETLWHVADEHRFAASVPLSTIHCLILRHSTIAGLRHQGGAMIV